MLVFSINVYNSENNNQQGIPFSKDIFLIYLEDINYLDIITGIYLYVVEHVFNPSTWKADSSESF